MEKKDICFFSDKTRLFYKIRQMENDLPCLEISGIRMHCVKEGIAKSTGHMVDAVKPLKGKVLDCCFGLGYTAIALSKDPKVDEVVVFEKDGNVVEAAKLNEESREAFGNKKIKLIVEPVEEGIKEFGDESFDRILHDPPSIKIAGELYSNGLYKEFYRVLKRGGILFHYTGTPGKGRGIDIMGGVARRLKLAGFVNAREEKKALGIIAEKK